MSLSQSLLPEFDHEMANTRKVLERIPEDKLTWKVHEKSNTIGWVGMHLADIPTVGGCQFEPGFGGRRSARRRTPSDADTDVATGDPGCV